jgi:hypothetical protein
MKTPLQLTRPHTHAGKQYPVGDRIELDSDLAQWLVSVGSARALPASPETDPPPPPEARPLSRKEPKQ